MRLAVSQTPVKKSSASTDVKNSKRVNNNNNNDNKRRENYIKKQEGGLFTAIRNNTDNTMDNRMTYN